MPYVEYRPGIRVWEGPRTEREELELCIALSTVASFPSANHRAALRSKEKEQDEESQQQEELPRST